jgi:2-polyprenyl-6-methoxyphenol hydroxylase-like FAD-dependent oxidoreductase
MELDPADLRGRYGHGVRMVHREDLTALLAGALAVNTVHRGLPVVHFEPGTPSSTLVLENGGRQHAELVVGADGLNSLVRRALIGDGAPRRSGLTAFRAVCAAGRPDLATLPWGETWGPGAVFGMAPLPGDQIYWYGTISSDEFRSSPLPTLKAMALDRFGHWNSGIAQLIGSTAEEAVMAHELFDRKPEPVWSGRSATLVGDAAHPMLPFLGQGAGQALEDAVALADALAADWNITTALRSYEQERAPHTAKVVKGSRKMANMAREQKPWKQILQRSVISMLPQAVVHRQLDDVVGRVKS